LSEIEQGAFGSEEMLERVKTSPLTSSNGRFVKGGDLSGGGNAERSVC